MIYSIKARFINGKMNKKQRRAAKIRARQNKNKKPVLLVNYEAHKQQLLNWMKQGGADPTDITTWWYF